MMDLSLISHITDLEGQKSAHKSNAKSETVQSPELQKIAKEMESLFAYQLLKIMRETANSISSERKDFGHSTYTSLFDMEISKLLSERGLGLQDSIIRSLERVSDSLESENKLDDKI
jgi:flagellar protein FlgJ